MMASVCDRNTMIKDLKQVRTAKKETVGDIFLECKQEFLKMRGQESPKTGNDEAMGKDQDRRAVTRGEARPKR